MNVEEQLTDFRNFLFVCWKHLKLPDPTPIQYEIAEWMQNGPKRGVIQGFRGVGKSWICSAYVVHQLYLDPQKNILVVSASKTRADDFSTFTLRLIHEMPILAHLQPKDKQRFSKISFDVGPATASHAPSVKSLGITSQLTGSRADLIVADDVEVPNNSATQGMRDKLSEQVKEFEAILKPDDDCKVLFLGTPQCEDSIYNKLVEREYSSQIWTAKKITPQRNEKVYKSRVSDICVTSAKKHVGDATEPTRVSDIDLAEREVSYGRSGFALQFMLDQSLSDLDRYPLKINDLIVTDLDPEVCYEKYAWSSDPLSAWNDLPCIGFNGDMFFRPMATSGDLVKYSTKILAIDPSGRGADETSYAAVAAYAGQLFVLECGGIKGGFEPPVLEELVQIAKRQKVQLILVEENFGQGMFASLLQPILRREYPCGVEETRHSIQKEKRIVDVLEPLLNSHKLIMNRSVIQKDYEGGQDLPPDKARQYQLVYQMSRLTRERGALRHDDRLAALAMACQFHVDALSRDTDKEMRDIRTERHEEMLRDYLDNPNGITIGKRPAPLTWTPPRP